MSKWKRFFLRWVLLSLVITGLMYGELLIESKFGYVEEERVSMDTSAILKRVPEVKITEADRALLEELSQCAAVRKLKDGEELAALSDEETASVLKTCLSEQEMETACVSGSSQGNAALEWFREKDEVFLLAAPQGDADCFKAYGKKASLSGGTLYENWDNKGAMETAFRRRWLAWIWRGLNRGESAPYG